MMELFPGSAGLSDLRAVHEDGARPSIDPGARPGVEAAAAIVAAAAAGDAAHYGINTGFGKLAQTRIDAAQTERLQRNLILSHCCGVGPDLPEPVVRLIMVLKFLSLGRGASGVRWVVIETLARMVAHRICPVIPAQGSVGASGDLAPLAHMTAAMMGEGNVDVGGTRRPAATALGEAGITPLVLGAKEGLALINGTQVSTALALAGLFDAHRLCRAALVTGALASDALMASAAPFRPEIHRLRGQPGQIDAAATLRALMAGSEIRESHRLDDDRVQDPYCLRCQPQVMGACLDLLRQAARTLLREANAVTDNPLIFVEDGSIVSGGNFHGEPVAFAADQLALAIAEMGAITERRIATLVDPALNFGLPPFLTPAPGLNSGFMIAEVTAAALYAENKQRAVPCSIDSTPTSANQEDHVSMATHGARRLGDMNRNLAAIIGIELLVAAQGVRMRAPLATSPPLARIVETLEARVPPLTEDRVLAPDIEAATDLVFSGTIGSSAGAHLLPELEAAP